ncbi:MAG: hypothetical protein ACE5HV_17080, partial [Acidobacteriota bacterium]
SPAGGPGHSDPAPMWFVRAAASPARGDETEAAGWLQRIVDSSGARADEPIAYVRSFYLLGQIHAKAGDSGRARQEYRRFLDYWQNGDIDRQRVAEAERFLR